MRNYFQTMKFNIDPRVAPVLLFAFLGVLTDFVFNGVLKITVPVIYIPTYLVVASTLSTWISRGKWAKLTWIALFGFTIGTTAGHLILSDHNSEFTYRFDFVNMRTLQPSLVPAVTLRPQSGKLYLVVTGQKFSEIFATTAKQSKVPVVIRVTTDYGCIKHFVVDLVSGVNVGHEALPNLESNATPENDTSWTWRNDPAPLNPSDAGPGFEDQILPWCRYRFI